MRGAVTGLLIPSTVQFFLLMTLFKKDRNDGEKGLFRRQQWTGIDAIILILCIVSFRFMAKYVSHSTFLHQHLWHQVPMYFPHLLLFALTWVILRFRAGQPINDLGFPRNSCFSIILLSTLSVLLLSAVFISFSFYQAFFIWAECAVSLLVVVPIVEEAIYRGILYSPYRKKYGAFAANLITSTIFAAAHDRDSIGAYVVLVAMGSLFAVLYEKKESLLYPIIAHSILSVPSVLAPLVR
jgi:membrane protease YdiL (CAAX protease family)